MGQPPLCVRVLEEQGVSTFRTVCSAVPWVTGHRSTLLISLVLIHWQRKREREGGGGGGGVEEREREKGGGGRERKRRVKERRQ